MFETREKPLLSTEEEQVMSQLALGHTDEVAATRLGMSRRTLRRRVHEAMEKLGARSRFQAGLRYAEWRQGACTAGPTER